MALAGEVKEILFADLLQFYCLSGQTAAVSITAPDERGRASSGTFFIDGGSLVDAQFDGRVGPDAVRQAVRRTKLGAFQVELGARSERRTIHQPWNTLVEEDPEAPALPLRVEPPPRRPTSPDRPPSVRPAPVASTATPHEPPAPRRTPVPPRTDPRQTGGGPAAAPARRRTVAPEPAPPTEPFPRIDRMRQRALLRWLLLVTAALAAGGGLAVVVSSLVNDPAESAAPAARSPAPGPGAAAGVTDTEVTFGMAAPLSGPSRELGRQMKLGLEAAFFAVNAEGGVHGRQVRLVAVDDADEPARTALAVRELAEKRGAFAFVGNVGPQAAAVALPDALGRQMLLFGSFSGAGVLRRDPPDRTVFNVRASEREEAAAIVRYLLVVRGVRADQIAVLVPDDGPGEASHQAVVGALRRGQRELPPVLRVTYPRNTADVAGAVARVVERGDRIRAVVMVAAYRAASRFIEQVRNQRPHVLFASLSSVGSTALADELMQIGPRFAAGVIVTQVVPLPGSGSSAVLRYRDALAAFAPGEKPDFVSLEGYLTGSLLLEGLRRSGRTVTTENMIRALETIRGLDLGLGTPVTFGPADHQGSHRVWGTVLDASGTYQPLDLD